jgi:hypothetical protein
VAGGTFSKKEEEKGTLVSDYTLILLVLTG